MADDFDVIVVGAGMAGCAAAIRLAQAGANVLLLERGPEPGVKNHSGGVLWGNDLARILPRWAEEMPLERHIVRKRFGILTSDRAVSFDYEDAGWRTSPYVAHSVLRVRTDAWLTKKAEDAGATVVAGVPVEKLLWEGSTVRGVVQGGEPMRAPVTIVADGVNSRLTLGTPIRPEPRLGEDEAELGMKEVYKLDPGRIAERFQLGPNEGHAEEWLLGIYPPGVMAGGFLYTNRDTISLGVIVRLGSLFHGEAFAHDMVETFKLHPTIHRAIEGGELVEYAAKLVGAGWAGRPAAFHGDGWLVAGDAAGFVFSNGLVIHGMNYAIRSGLEAAETALVARAAHDASAARLADYDRRLDASGILADFRGFRGLDRVKWNPRLYTFYPRFATELFHRLYSMPGDRKEHLWRTLRKAQQAVGLGTDKLVRDGIDIVREM